MLNPQIQTGDPRICTIFILAWGANWGYSGFSQDQNNPDSSDAYVLRSEQEDKHAWKAAQCAKILDAFCLQLFACVLSAKTWIPTIRARADNAITQGGIRVLWSPVHICGWISPNDKQFRWSFKLSLCKFQASEKVSTRYLWARQSWI